jgi:1,4-dihydroxy-6-naphthoate synthase
VPGYLTTAYLLLRLIVPEAKVIVLPFDEIIPSLQNGTADAGLLIHEGQLTYAHSGLKRIMDLGQWWYQKTNLPLPLGGNVIKRDLGSRKILQLSKMVKASITYALANRQAALQYALNFARGMPEELADRYIEMYVNELSVDCGYTGRQAVKTLFQLATEAKLIEEGLRLEFVA